MNASIEQEAGQINAVTRLGMVCNTLLAIAKLIVGFFVGSLALIADGFNSLSDILTDIAVLIGTSLGARPADASHPYGHGKIETIVALMVDLGVLSVGMVIIYTAVKSLAGVPEIPSNGMAIVIVAIATILTKEWLFHRTVKVAVKSRSAALRGKAWDHRSDVAVSSVVLAGGVGSLAGWEYGDAIAGLIVGLVVLVVGAKLVFETLLELTEGSAGAETEKRIDEVLTSFVEIRGWHKLRTRRIGRELLMDVHILLDPELTIENGHSIVTRIEEAMQKAIDWPINLTVHIDPDNHAIRSARVAAGDKTLR
jgi:cation diffusion facilitator family transporter